MGKPDWEGDGKITIVIIARVVCLCFIPFCIFCSLKQAGWRQCRGFFERRGWIKPTETEEDKLMKQHPRPVVPKSLQSTIPAVLSWMSTRTSPSAPDLDSATTAPGGSGASYHSRGGPSQSRDKRASVISASFLEGTAILESLRGDNHDGDGGSFQSLATIIKTKMPTDGNYNRAGRRNAIDHGRGTGTGVWLETASGSRGVAEYRRGTAVASSSGSSPQPPQESAPKAKERFPLISAPSQAVSTSSISPSPTPKNGETAQQGNTPSDIVDSLGS
ncbi:hypothetical protein QBC32DRAFT_269972 [Pseudoneurospora amorphoporcata]|uniref:Uncharacterized protein n=1 Tax=Pseudoneurospora amorphoporcata TaxID=241081 RepID=A0AAN6SB94_9PEZI|nr:hypothetical protein QBC32DRAFT_269972 [Pseudoneurospora amorphoporcata]